MALDVAVFQPLHESCIEADQALSVVKVGEADDRGLSEGDAHVRNIRVGRGVIRSCANRLDNAGPERSRHQRFATLMLMTRRAAFTHGPAAMQPIPGSVRNWLIADRATHIFVH